MSRPPGLDAMVRREFLESMVDLASNGRTVLLSSHQIGEVERVASHVALLHQGKLILAEPLDELKARTFLLALTFTSRDHPAAPTANLPVELIDAADAPGRRTGWSALATARRPRQSGPCPVSNRSRSRRPASKTFTLVTCVAAVPSLLRPRRRRTWPDGLLHPHISVHWLGDRLKWLLGYGGRTPGSSGRSGCSCRHRPGGAMAGAALLRRGGTVWRPGRHGPGLDLPLRLRGRRGRVRGRAREPDSDLT